MGMFDNVRCELPLPGIGVTPRLWQTKDTPSQFLDTYVIREDGTLWMEAPNIEMLDGWPDESRPLGGPMFRRTGQPEPVEWTGEMRFYDIGGNNEWIEYRATFVQGRLHGEIEPVEEEPA